MNKISQRMLTLFKYKENGCRGNDCISHKRYDNCHVSEWRYRNNSVATLYFQGGTMLLRLDTCGWKTKTTKSRMNAVLSWLFPTKKIFQHQGKWYIHDLDTKKVVELERQLCLMKEESNEQD